MKRSAISIVEFFGITIIIVTMLCFTPPLHAALEKLHDFSGEDGSAPVDSLVVSGSTLYGMTQGGGNTRDEYLSGMGVIFSISTSGAGYSPVHKFSGENPGSPGDGAEPLGSLLISGSKLYSTTYTGGFSDLGMPCGTVFSVNPDGTDYTTLRTFRQNDGVYNYADGRNPQSTFVASGTTLYATTYHGGARDNQAGTVFKIEADGSGYETLYAFSRNADSKAHNPLGALVLSGDTLYGMTVNGGDGIAYMHNEPFIWYEFSPGAIYSVKTDGSGFSILHAFEGGENDGATPFGSLLLSGSTLYGMTTGGGGGGTIFSVGVDGNGFSILHSFLGGPNDGSTPWGSLLLSGSTLYGMTQGGGDSECGTLFSMGLDGNDFTLLHEFSGLDGVAPLGSLILSGNFLYGMTSSGGSSWNMSDENYSEGNGTIFRYGLGGGSGGEAPEPSTIAVVIITGLGLAAKRWTMRRKRNA